MRVRCTTRWFALVVLLTTVRPARSAAPEDRFSFSVSSRTYAELFRRALLPGPNGAVVVTDTVVPVNEYLSLRARDLDTALGEDSLDVELAAYGRVTFGDPGLERRADGDLQVASVRLRREAFWARLGRQQMVGGAARYSRFDGAAAGLELGLGLGAELYGGFTVLPRWDQAPGYHLLGAAPDSALRDPELLAAEDRSGSLLGGGRLSFTSAGSTAAVSFHEQRESAGLVRRNLGFDGRLSAAGELGLGGSALFEVDARALQDARVWVDATVVEPLDVSLEYLHTEPALFLSRQSVLSVFGSDGYDEAGLSAVARVNRRLALEGDGSVQFYDESQRGARGELGVRVLPGSGGRTVVRLAFARVLAPGNGYHSLRAALSRRLTRTVSGSLEAYSYLYDEPIRTRISSEVYSGTLGYLVAERVKVLWGASLAQSPYATFDAQTLVRLDLDLEFGTARDAE